MDSLIERILLIVFSTFLLVVFLVPFIKKIAVHIDALDYPKERNIHKKPIPRLGGVAIFLGFLFGYMLFGETSEMMNSILIASFIIVLVGVIDDIKSMPPYAKFFGQLFAAAIVVFYGNLLIDDITIFGLEIVFGFLAIPLTLFFILGCINCMNFIDGLDGLAAGVSSIYFLTIGIIAVMMNKLGLDFVLTFIMLGCVIGFLVYNFHPASIFMGDSGSMFLGFIIAVIALLGFKNVTLTSLIIPLLILAIPILDTIFAIIRRLISGKSISTPDKYHIHHQLLNRNLSQRTVVFVILLVNALFAIASLFYLFGGGKMGIVIYAVLVFLVVLFVLRTSVIMENKRGRFRKILSFFLRR